MRRSRSSRLFGPASNPRRSNPVPEASLMVRTIVDAFDLCFELVAPTEEDLEALIRLLPGSWEFRCPPNSTDTDSRVRFSALWTRARGVERVAIDSRQEIAARRTLDILTRLPATLESEVAARSQHTFLHAGVVATNGRALVVPGCSFDGKSRLVRALVEAGASYYSDDLAVVDAEARVHAVGNPLALRHPDTTRSTVPAKRLGWSRDLPSLPIGLVYFGRFRPRAIFRPSRLAAGDATMSLLAHTISSAPDQFRTLVRIARRAISLRGDRGEATATASSLMELLRSGARGW